MATSIVVDASVASAWSFAEPFSTPAQSVLNAIEAHRITPLAPDRFAEEFLRVCQKKTHPPPDGAGLVPDDAWESFLDVVTSPIVLLPSGDYHEQAWKLALEAKLTTHDALYLAVAERWAAELWTADDHLATRGSLTDITVRHLRDHPFPY